MIPASPSFPGRHALTVCAALALAGLLAVACSDQPDPTGPVDDASNRVPGISASQHVVTGYGIGSVDIEVRTGGTRFANVLVTLVHNLHGPFAPDAPVEGKFTVLLKAVTNSQGIASFQGLAPGGYCAHVTAISDLANVTTTDFEVPRASQVASTATVAPSITERQGGGVRTVPFTEDNYVKNCIETTPQDPNAPPIEITESRPSVGTVRVSPGQGGSFKASFRDLNGISVPVAGWLVFGKTDEDWRELFPWFENWFQTVKGEGPPHDLLPGILLGVRAQVGLDNQGRSTFRGLPTTNLDFAFEVLSNRPDQGLLVATSRRSTTSGDAAAVTMEPLMCVINEAFPPAAGGTATGGMLEVVGNVFDGWRATEAFNASNDVGIWYDVEGSGSDILRLRFKGAGNATQQVQIPYSCTSSGCTLGSASGSAVASPGFSFNMGSRPTEVAGRRQVTWVINNPPFGSSLASVEWRVRDYPETARDDDTRGFRLIPDKLAPGTRCEVAKSNDPRWWIAN